MISHAIRKKTTSEAVKTRVSPASIACSNEPDNAGFFPAGPCFRYPTEYTATAPASRESASRKKEDKGSSRML